MIKPLIKGSAFITGKQELYVSKMTLFLKVTDLMIPGQI